MATRQARRWQIRARLCCKDKSQSVSRDVSSAGSDSKGTQSLCGNEPGKGSLEVRVQAVGRDSGHRHGPPLMTSRSPVPPPETLEKWMQPMSSGLCLHGPCP